MTLDINTNVLLVTRFQTHKNGEIVINTYNYIFIILNTIEIILLYFDIPRVQIVTGPQSSANILPRI
jgi:hypothetical protein